MIAIISYGLGNVSAFATVFRNLAIPHRIAKNTDDLSGATKIILPGVGSFDHAMTSLTRSGLTPALNELVINRQVPVLGVCVGLQMMGLSSEEGAMPGLGWINATVRRLPGSAIGGNLPLPHMGWNTVHPKQSGGILKDLGTAPPFYFLHSYYFDCRSPDDILATTDYGIHFPSVVKHGNVFGMQCHPEKSHQQGTRFLQNFALL